MPTKAEIRRKDLRDRLIDIAEQVIRKDGLGAIKARDLATQAGCALGAIYNVFDDLGDLVLEVNARTFQRLGASVAESLAAAPLDPTEQMIVMAQAYHRFAAENLAAWRALFDLERPQGSSAPDWYLAEMGQLFAYIDGPLTALFPKMDQDERALLTRGLFSSIHGIVLLGLDGASAGVPADRIDTMIALILRRIAPE